MQVRKMEAGDASAVQHMIDGLAEFHGDVPSALSESDVQDLIGPDPWIIILVVESDGGQLAGYVALTRIGQLQFAKRGMDIHHLFVRPEMRGNGFGAALIQASVAYALERGCSAVTVGTAPDKHEALKYYEAIGFKRRPSGGPRLSIRI